MIVIDDRIGSKEFEKPLRTLGAQVKVDRLEFADFAFEGKGPEGRPVSVGVERKDIGDLLQCMADHRFTDHQLPGLLAHYEVVYLIVEGAWRPSHEGTIEILRHGWGAPPSGRDWSYEAVINFLTSLEARAGIKVRRTTNKHETAFNLYALERWWNKGWEEHHSIEPFSGVDVFGNAFAVKKPSLLWQVASRLPGIGSGKVGAVAKRFGSVRDLVLATDKEWEEVKGSVRLKNGGTRPWSLTEKSIKKIQNALDGDE